MQNYHSRKTCFLTERKRMRVVPVLSNFVFTGHDLKKKGSFYKGFFKRRLCLSLLILFAAPKYLFGYYSRIAE